MKSRPCHDHDPHINLIYKSLFFFAHHPSVRSYTAPCTARNGLAHRCAGAQTAHTLYVQPLFHNVKSISVVNSPASINPRTLIVFHSTRPSGVCSCPRSTFPPSLFRNVTLTHSDVFIFLSSHAVSPAHYMRRPQVVFLVRNGLLPPRIAYALPLSKSASVLMISQGLLPPTFSVFRRGLHVITHTPSSPATLMV